jgi:hypothetical protein
MILRTVLLALICGTLFMATPSPAQWQAAASPAGDPVDRLHPAGAELYCLSYLGKVYVTTDQAQTWTEIGTMTHGTAINSLVIHDDWMLISRQGWAGNHRIRRTAEGWTAWEPWPDQDHEYHHLTVWGGRIFAVSNNGLVVSDDYGLAWSPVATPDGRRAYQLMGARGALFLVTRNIGQSNGLLHRSVDGGVTWQDVTGPLAPISVHAWAEHQGAIYVVKYLGGGQGEVYRSVDDGLSFELYTGMPTTGYAPSAFAHGGIVAGRRLPDIAGDELLPARRRRPVAGLRAEHRRPADQRPGRAGRLPLQDRRHGGPVARAAAGDQQHRRHAGGARGTVARAAQPVQPAHERDLRGAGSGPPGRLRRARASPPRASPWPTPASGPGTEPTTAAAPPPRARTCCGWNRQQGVLARQSATLLR